MDVGPTMNYPLVAPSKFAFKLNRDVVISIFKDGAQYIISGV